MFPLKNFTEVDLNNATPQSCDLLDKMPAEIRNRIYELTFSVTVELGRGAPQTNTVTNRAGRPKAPGVLCSCKQVYQEAVKIYWTTTKFFFAKVGSGYPRPDPVNDAAAWPNAIGRRRRELLCDVRVRLFARSRYAHRSGLLRCKAGRRGLAKDAVKISLEFQGMDEIWCHDPERFLSLHADKKLILR